MFSVSSPPKGGGGYPSQVPSLFRRLWSQVLSGVRGTPLSGPMSLLGIPQSCPGSTPVLAEGGTIEQGTPSQPGQGTPWPGLWYPPGQDWDIPLPWDRLRCGWYASCGVPQENFIVLKRSMNCVNVECFALWMSNKNRTNRSSLSSHARNTQFMNSNSQEVSMVKVPVGMFSWVSLIPARVNWAVVVTRYQWKFCSNLTFSTAVEGDTFFTHYKLFAIQTIS